MVNSYLICQPYDEQIKKHQQIFKDHDLNLNTEFFQRVVMGLNTTSWL